MPTVTVPGSDRPFQFPEGTPPEEMKAAIDRHLGKDTSTFSKMSVSDTAKQHLASMASGPAKAQYDQAQASASQDIKNSLGRAAGEAAAMAPFAIAAPLTWGASLGLGAAIMGGAGLAGGIAKIATKAAVGSNEIPKSRADLSLALGVDTLAGVGGEVAGRGLMLGKTLLPKIIERAAARSDAGKILLRQKFSNLRNQLYEAIGTAAIPKAAPEAMAVAGEKQAGAVFADVERPVREAYASLNKLPKAPFLGGSMTEFTPDAAEIIKGLEADLHLQVGIGHEQPLDGLIRAKGNFQQKVFASKTMNDEERVIFEKLATDLHDIISKETKDLGPNVAGLYKKVNDLGVTLNKATVANTIAEKFINTYTGRAAIGATIGGGEGYRRGGAGGAAAGVAIGAGASVAIPGLATVILQQTMRHPQAASTLSRALELAIQGKKTLANEVSARAFGMAGVRETIKEAAKQAPEQP